MAEASDSCYDSEDDADGDEGASDHGTAAATAAVAKAAASLDRACGKAAVPACRGAGPGAAAIGASGTGAAGRKLLPPESSKAKAPANSTSTSKGLAAAAAAAAAAEGGTGSVAGAARPLGDGSRGLAGSRPLAAAAGGMGPAASAANSGEGGIRGPAGSRSLAAAAGLMQAPVQLKQQKFWLNPWLLAVFPGKVIKEEHRLRIPMVLYGTSYSLGSSGADRKDMLVQVKMPAKVAKEWGALGSGTEAAEWPGEELMVVQQLTAHLRKDASNATLSGVGKAMKRFFGCRIFCYEVVSRIGRQAEDLGQRILT